jgi:hypothetical protein
MGARNRGGIGLSYRPARLHMLVEFIPWNQFRGPINIKKYGLRIPGVGAGGLSSASPLTAILFLC